MNTQELYQELSRRPTATTLTVRELIQRAQAGQVRVPIFQRPLRWQNDQVIELMDSIWRGYPIGSLLFWKREAKAEEIKIGNAMLHAPALPDALWVVDGQQRLTALSASLSDFDQNGDRRWDVFFRADSQTFYGGTQADPNHVPLSKLGDLKRLGRWLRETTLSDELAERIEEAQQRLLDYSIPAYIVDTDDEQALRAVFARLNSTGSRMRADEVFQALLGATDQSHPNTLDLDYLQTACRHADFGTPPRSEILKCVLAMSGFDTTRNLADLSQGLDKLISRDDAFSAIQKAAFFLKNECGIPHFNLIPYPVVFFILTRWFHIFPETAVSYRQILARWVWRGALSGTHVRSEVSTMRLQVRDIVFEDGIEESLTRLLSRTPRKSNVTWSLDTFNSKNARSRIETLALLSLGPENTYGTISANTMLESGRIAREIWSTRDQKPLEGPTKDLARSAANRVILDSRHTGLYPEMESWPNDSPIWQTHLVSKDAQNALRNHDVSTFLQIRSHDLQKYLMTFLEQKCLFNEPIVFPAMAEDADLAI